MKLFDSELKVMDVLWTNGDMPARQIARHPDRVHRMEREYHLHPHQALHRQKRD